MTTSTATLVNVDTSDPAIGAAVINLVVAAAVQPSRTEHLQTGGIINFMFDAKEGIGFQVRDAGTRQHLANALGFDRQVTEGVRRSTGQIVTRSGEILGVKVGIWNLEY